MTKNIFLFIVCILFSCVWADLMPFFLILESSESTEQEIQATINVILKQGSKVLPDVQKRFNKTKNPKYLYIIEKLKNFQIDMEDYFKNKWIEAKFLWKKGEKEKAKQLAESILILEPHLPFANEIQIFLKKNKKSNVPILLKTTIQTEKKYYTHNQDIEVYFCLENTKNSKLSIVNTVKNQIFLDIRVKEYHPQGYYKTYAQTKTIYISPEVYFQPKEKLLYKTKIKNNISHNVFITYEIQARLLRCRIVWENQSQYPNLVFATYKVHSLPIYYKTIQQNPWNHCLRAMQISSSDNLFYASFFLSQEEKAKLIPYLIQDMIDNTKTSDTSQGILKRYTHQSFSSIQDWKIWWEGNKYFPHKIIKETP